MKPQRRDWSERKPDERTKPLEVLVRGANPERPFQFDSKAQRLFEGHLRIEALSRGAGVLLSAIWYPDLNEAHRILAAEFPDPLVWGDPEIRYRFETIHLPDGRTREITLEPYLTVVATTPESAVGVVLGDLSSRRGQIWGMEEGEGDLRVISAWVPLSQSKGYPEALAAMTGGSATAEASYHGYQEAPRLPPDPREPKSAVKRA